MSRCAREPRWGVLGETLARSADGGPLALGGAGRRAVLAMLILDTGRTVTAARLIDGLYGPTPPAGAANALQSQVSRLRGVLRGSGGGGSGGGGSGGGGSGGGGSIENHPAGYRLAVDPDQVDVYRFGRLAAQGREALGAGDAMAADELLSDALALWRGPALADVRDAPFALAQVARLEDLRLTACEDRASARLRSGRHRETIADLRDLVAAEPLRERLTTLLVTALHADGRQAEALKAYADARTVLAETLGADPGPELAAAHLAVLRGDPVGDMPAGPGAVRGRGATRDVARAGRPIEPPTRESPSAHGGERPGPGRDAGPAAGPVPRRLNLPASLNGLIGRDGELARIGDLLRGARLLTVTGPGGAGKTRIAVEAAARHPADSCFADLSGLNGADDLPQALLGALGLRGSALLGPAEGPAPLERLANVLADRPSLLVLDNCEHLVAQAARLAADLLAGCPALRILATSREALGITGEVLLALPPLPDGAAARLFAERATAVRPDFDPDRDPAAVAEICGRLDGLPLAIELAAARSRLLTPRQVADRLDDRFRLLTGGSRTARPRQQTLRAVVDWSWDLLPEAERAVLRRASVFSGGFSLAAAEAVCADPAADGFASLTAATGNASAALCAPTPAVAPALASAESPHPADILDLLGSLVDKSLLIAVPPVADAFIAEDAAATVSDPGIRFRMLQTVRAYAAGKLTESGEADRVERAHLGFFFALAAHANPLLRTADQLHWLRLLAADHENLHAALRRADALTGLRLIGEMALYWLLRGRRFEATAHAARVLEAIGPIPRPDLAEEYAICVILAVQNEANRAALAEQVAVGERLMTRFRLTPRRNPVVLLLWAPFSGVPLEMTRMTPEQEALWLVDPWHRGLAHVGQGFLFWYVTGDWAAADREFSAAIEVYQAIGDRWGSILALTELAGITDALGQPDRSRELTARALRLAGELGATEDTAELLCGRAERAERAGDLTAAEADCEQAISLFQQVGSVESIPRARLCLARVARKRADLAAARRYCAAALGGSPAATWFGAAWLRFYARIELARVELADGNLGAARELFREALPADVDTRNLPALAAGAEGLARLTLAQGDPGQAAYLQGVALALRHSAGPADAEQQALTEAIRVALGKETVHGDADGNADGQPASGAELYTEAHARGAALRPDQAIAALTSAAQHPSGEILG